VRELKDQRMRPVDIAKALKIARASVYSLQGARAGIELTGMQMPKSTAEKLRALEKLIDEYLAFQRGRPDLPQANLSELYENELEQFVTAFQLHKSEQGALGQIERPIRLH
jgi:hypothetical protein